MEPGEIKYVGPSTPEIENAWEDLVGGEQAYQDPNYMNYMTESC
jgi:hypothetical protein